MHNTSNIASLAVGVLLRHRIFYFSALATIFFTIFTFLYIYPPSMWQVSGLIRIGQAPSALSKDDLILEKLMSSELSMSYLRQKAAATTAVHARRHGKWDFRLRPVGADLLKLEVTAQSKDGAAEIYGELLNGLKSVHADLFRARYDFWKGRQSTISTDVEIGEKIWKSQTSACQWLTKRSLEGQLLCANLLAHESERQNREKLFLDRLQEVLMPSWSYPTDSFGEIEVSIEPVTPRLFISITSSLCIALAVVTIMLLVQGVWSAVIQRASR